MLRLAHLQKWISGLQAPTPTRPKPTAAKFALRRVLETLFEGSVEKAVAAHLSDPKSDGLDPAELNRLSTLIEETKKKEGALSRLLKPRDRFLSGIPDLPRLHLLENIRTLK